MKSSVPEEEKHFVRYGLILAGVIVVLVALAWVWQAPLKSWRMRHAIRQGLVYQRVGENHKAQLSARRALQLDPENADAKRLLADIARDSFDPAEIALRRDVAQTTGSAADCIAWALGAIRVRDAAAAARALDAIPKADRTTAEFFAATAGLAELTERPREADAGLVRATKLAPKNQSYRLSLAALRLGHSELEGRDEARMILRQLLEVPEVQKQAARVLIGDAFARSDVETATAVAEKLDSFPGALFGDRLLYLGTLQAGRRIEFSTELESLETECGSDATKSAALVQWLSANRLSIVALEWAHTRPSDMMSSVSFCAAVADCYESLGDWRNLRDLLVSRQWGAMDYSRLAKLARACRGLNDDVGFRKNWDDAVRLAGLQPAALTRLAKLATEWKWRDEAIELSWRLVKVPQFRIGALNGLRDCYYAAHDTAGLFRVTTAQFEDHPEDAALQNNRAQLALLLDVATAKEVEMAKRNFAQTPHDADIASTYAFSLYRARDFKGAIGVMQTLPPAALEKPVIAAYYGVLLAAGGRESEAAPFLERGATAELLPEELRLVREAQTRFVRTE